MAKAIRGGKAGGTKKTTAKRQLKPAKARVATVKSAKKTAKPRAAKAAPVVRGPNPMAVMQAASAYWNSAVLHVAAGMDVFTKLAARPMTADEVAAACGADARGTEMILIGCVGLGFLQKKAGKFQNTKVAETFLVKGAPRYQGGIVTMFESWVPAWSQLKTAVMQGRPVVEKQHDHGPEETRTYIMGMLYRGIPQAQLLAKEVPLKGRKRLLDVGGGPGIFSIIFCQKNKGLSADVFDLPQTLAVTRDIIRDYQAEGQVHTREGSYLSDSFGSGYDAVLLSSMINQEGPDVIRNIIAKSFDALESGGLLMIQEQFLNTEKSGPLLPVLIGLNQLVHTPAGRAYSAKEVADMAEEIGFRKLSFRALPEPSPFTLITGVKP
ncbi:MAG: acetylserotonin O-methyltransferase [Gammaproteobacteria bacterium]|nr:acetylserotonin O-methyltransferase [Gammaproteobacteria bacterium]